MIKKRDLLWIISVLLIINVLTFSLRLSDDQDITNILSIGGSLVSVILGIVAIFISFIQNNSSQDLHGRMSSTLEIMNNKLESINNNINNIKPYTNNNTLISNTTKSKFNLTRIHGICSTSIQWNGKRFVDIFTEKLMGKGYSLIDYSIQPLQVPLAVSFKFSTNIFLLIEGSIDQNELELLIDETFEEMGILNNSTDYHINPNL